MKKSFNQSLSAWQNRILWLCWIAYALSYLCRTNLSIALPTMTAQFEWSTSAAGMIGSAFFLSYAVGHLVNGFMGDRIPIKRFLLLGLIGTSLCNLIIGFFPNYIVIFIVWLVNGLFLSTLWGPIIRAIACWYPSSERNTPAIIISFSSLAGYLISWAGLGVLVSLTGWQAAFFFPGILTILFTLWFAFRMNDNPASVGFCDYSSETADAKTETPPATASISLWQLICREKLLWFCVAAIAQGIIKDGITLWEPTMLTAMYDAPTSLISIVSAAIPIFSFIGVLLSGKLMNRYIGHEKIPGMLLFFITAIACVLFYLLMGRILWLDVLFFGIISALLCGINALLLTFIPLRLSSYGRASTVAGMFNFSAYLGAGCSGILSGFLADLFGWSSSIVLWIFLCVIGIVSVFLGFAPSHAADTK
ncbi:MFS transporter [Phocea massiliensis]|uniref:MFS transporter n=1 Tax=Merdimmobilis hominis TaxID=2897707 RepID=A0A939BCZ5_9FIRM|nr:MFS transporter [Merdimmobilis hominis]MBM6920649.1 MFS transporter [Merdimmobilis hominis]